MMHAERMEIKWLGGDGGDGGDEGCFCFFLFPAAKPPASEIGANPYPFRRSGVRSSPLFRSMLAFSFAARQTPMTKSNLHAVSDGRFRMRAEGANRGQSALVSARVGNPNRFGR